MFKWGTILVVWWGFVAMQSWIAETAFYHSTRVISAVIAWIFGIMSLVLTLVLWFSRRGS